MTLKASPLPKKVCLELPASHQYLNVVGACLRAFLEYEQGMEDREVFLYQVELAVHEVCINIIEHAYAGASGSICIHITVEDNPHQLVTDLFDTGAPFNPLQVEQIDINEPRIRGYGLFLIHELMDKVTYTLEQDKNHWCLKKRF